MANEVLNMETIESVWDKFINREIFINCRTKEDSEVFLNYCFDNGVFWGDNLREFDQWEWNEEDTCYSVYEKYRLNYDDITDNIKTFIFKAN
jgi:hypothetical protein